MNITIIKFKRKQFDRSKVKYIAITISVKLVFCSWLRQKPFGPKRNPKYKRKRNNFVRVSKSMVSNRCQFLICLFSKVKFCILFILQIMDRTLKTNPSQWSSNFRSSQKILTQKFDSVNGKRKYFVILVSSPINGWISSNKKILIFIQTENIHESIVCQT